MTQMNKEAKIIHMHVLFNAGAYLHFFSLKGNVYSYDGQETITSF